MLIVCPDGHTANVLISYINELLDLEMDVACTFIYQTRALQLEIISLIPTSYHGSVDNIIFNYHHMMVQEIIAIVIILY
jgi:hypothetical protein